MSNKTTITLISLAAVLALSFFLIKPTWSSIKILKAEIINQEERVAQVEELLNKFRQVEETYQQLKEEADKISISLPEEKDLPHLLVQFDSLAANNGLLFQAVNFGQLDPKKKEKFPKLDVKLQLSGSYDAFKNYLVALERNARSMDIQSINFGQSGRAGSGGDLANFGIFNFNLGINVYYQ